MAAKTTTTSVKDRVEKALDRLAEDHQLAKDHRLAIYNDDSDRFDEMLTARSLDPKSPEHVRAAAVTICSAVFRPGRSGPESKWKHLNQFDRDYCEVRKLPGVETAEAAYKKMKTEKPWSEKYGGLATSSLRKLKSLVCQDPAIRFFFGDKIDDTNLRDWPAFTEALERFLRAGRAAESPPGGEDQTPNLKQKAKRGARR